MKNNIVNLTERQVLDQLDIPDFRHLSKGKIMTFFSMLPNMNPDVAQKAIEQFPVYADVVKEVVKDFMVIVNTILAENAKDNQACYDACNKIMTELSKQLEKDDLSFEERKYFIEQLLEIEDRINKKNTENKEFYLKVLALKATVVIAFAGATIAVLGVRSRFTLPKVKT